MQQQIDQMQKQRDEDAAQILIFEQMLADFKQNENQGAKDLEDQIEDLKAKLDKTEYIIQYKEKVWTYLEREIRKVVNEDSDLMQKVKEQTRILTDCLATTKVSNVVKQNDNLQNDHTMGCEKLQQINQMLKQDLISSEELQISTENSASNQKKREHLHNMKGSIFSEGNLNDNMEGQRLYTLVMELDRLVDAQRTRLDLIDAEATHFRQQYNTSNKEYNRMKS